MVKVTLADPPLEPGLATTLVGTVGTGLTRIDADAPEAREVPLTLVAVTVNEYDTPLVKLLTLIGLLVPVANPPDGDEVTL